VSNPTDIMGRRVAAWLIDWLLLGVAYWALFAAFAKKTSDHVDSSAFFAKLTLGGDTYAVTGGRAALFFAIWIVVATSYAGVLPGRTGWTPGKRALGLRVVRPQTGEVPGAGRGIARAYATIIDLFPYFIPMLVGFLVALNSPARRRVADLIADTVVVSADAVGSPVPLVAAAPSAPPPPGPTAAPANWYPDPGGEKRLRWWDGQRWTDHTAD
jgi:uncharacterized RDD family membrane protein YckC